ncbi:putative F-box/FBD/LRR-repeat protein At1g78760 [Salvia miltiorrhiza]|uniref:putative F-box/FBD/LRR-repeat protein At1g78760 n=1 Tax=Salvia miltiorrhiza TaxID=226208 RepID=UPI0025AD50DF|nr:putative F-box/FBD/LRR-repeat protein At1g78760 [Salvia miltiorrhiza]
METHSQFVVNAYSPPRRRSYSWLDDGGKVCSGGDDRLSALPDSLCHQIVSLLPATDARRTAFLSRRWRYIWCACPSFNFDEREFHGRPLPLLHRYRSRLNFIRFVDAAIQCRRRFFDDLTLDKFRVSMRFFEELGPHLDQWIAFALDKNVKELSIIAEMKDLIAIAEFFQPFRVPYELPGAVFSARSIQTLELVFCDLSRVSAAAVSLPLLKNLEMVNVHLGDDSVLEAILSTSPLLEKISLSLVCGLKRMRISGENLKMAVVLKCSPLSQVTVSAPNLESFLFRGKRHSLDKIDVSSCRNLRFLWLQRASNLTDDALEKVVAQNGNLEVMILSHCSAVRNAFIKSPKLWMLVLFKCKHLANVKIQAPSLTALEYSGHMISFPSVAASPNLDAVIHIEGPEISSRWYAKLKDMCAKLESCRKLWIKCEHDIDLIIPHDLRKRLLPQLHGLKELKIHVRSGILNLAVLEDGIRWIFPGLRNLYVESDGCTHHFCYAGDLHAANGYGRRTKRKCITHCS